MVDLKQLYQDLTEKITTAEQEEEQLNTDEEKELKYLNREDIPGSLEIFSEEVDLAVQLTEHIEQAEEDELEAEEYLKNADVPEKVRKRYMNSEQELEDVIETAVTEMQRLKKEAEMLEGEIQSSDATQEEIQEFKQDRRELKQALSNMQEVKKEGEMMMTRRNALGVMAGAAAGSAWAMNRKIDHISNKAEKLIEQQERRIEETQRTSKKEGTKPKRDIGGGKDQVLEEIDIGNELYAKINIVRTTPATAITYIELQNRSNQTQTLELDLSAVEWEVKSIINFGSSNSNGAKTQINLKPQTNFEAGALLNREGKKAGRLEYMVKTGNNSEKMMLNFPAKNQMNTVKPDSVAGVQLRYSREKDTKKGDLELDFAFENTSGKNLHVQAALILPTGWEAAGYDNTDSGGAGMYSISSDLRNMTADGFSLYLDKRSKKAAKAAALCIAVIPDENPEKKQSYIVPVGLER